jgi:trans-aconitate 2-methyltransferase
MVEEVRKVLRPGDEAIVSDLTKLELDEQVDAVFSTAVFHWISDHDALFARMRAALRDGGRFAAQCGGEGNIDVFRRAGEEVAAREPYAPHLEGIEALWNYAGPQETEARLRAAGFTDVRCWLEPWPVEPPEPEVFSRTICLGAHVARLPEDLRDQFVADVLATQAEPLVLEYVRLNIEATAA